MKQLIYNPLVAIIFTIVTAVITFSLYRNTQEIKKSTQSIQILEDQIEKKEANIDHLENQLDQSSSEFTQEKIIRNELLLQKEGEYIVQIADQADDQIAQQAEKINNKTPWQEWKELILE